MLDYCLLKILLFLDHLDLWNLENWKPAPYYSQARDCFICKKGGHRANVCPEKHKNVSSSLKICLKCGDSGHDMFSCQNHYADDDLKVFFYFHSSVLSWLFSNSCFAFSLNSWLVETFLFLQKIQCYICKKFGHLCCVNSTSDTSVVSCYKCGQTGHTGLVSPLCLYLTVDNLHLILISPFISIWDILWVFYVLFLYAIVQLFQFHVHPSWQ